MKKLIVRILAGIGVVIGLLAVASGVLLAVFWDEATVKGGNLIAIFFEEPEYADGFANREETLDYLKAHSGHFSLVSYTASDEGSTSDIEHLPDRASPLASTKKVVVLAAYAKEVSEGSLDPDEEIPVSEWERYYIPNADGGAHPAAMEDLGIPTEEDGTASVPEATATLDEMVGAMISVSDNAATDYLIERLGQVKIQAVIEDENLTGQEPILPISGSMLVWSGPDGEGTPGLAEMSREEYAAEVLQATESYTRDEYPDEWREGRAPLGSLVDQREMVSVYETRGTAKDYARIMSEVASGEFISPEASEVMRRHLEWPMETDANKEEFRTLGAKGGSLSGVLNQASYAVPKRDDFSDETRVVVLFTREMSVSAWLGAQQSEGYNDFMHALATDREFAEKVGREIQEEQANRKSGKETSGNGKLGSKRKRAGGPPGRERGERLRP